MKHDDEARTPSSRRRFAGSLGFAGAAAVAALLLGACGSASGSGTGTGTTNSTLATSTSTPTDPAAQLAAIETVPSASVSLQETGSSLLYPLFAAWAGGYHTAWPNVGITTSATGSGTGISDAIAGTVDIGASDAYLPPADFSEHPSLENIPLAISAQQVNYNVTGLPARTHLRLDGTVLAEMYAGKIGYWDDPAIKSLNPGVRLPHLAVHPIHRSDSSGDTFLFTSYLTDAAPSDWTLGYNTSITFPDVPNSAGALKNSGMVSACKATPGCVAYIGVSYLAKTTAAGLGEAMLANKSGNYELPEGSTILAEATSFSNVPADGAISLIYGPAGDGYPIVNFEYAIVNATQSDSGKAQAIKSVLAWAMDPSHGSATSYLSAVDFQPLPAGALQVAVNLLKQIS